MERAIAAVFLLLTGSLASAADQSRNDAVRKCSQLHSQINKAENATYCECVVDVSQSLVDNDPIFNIYLKSTDENSALRAFDDLVYSTVYDHHNFSSIKEKKEFIQGKSKLFVSRVKKACGNSLEPSSGVRKPT
ncbi:hypothetical protein [Kumtagia ephedrae]|jgi:hypothetical protein|uniref:hypothetical protein n=1 Tax=Kumtagia ephedrae TaxID=2116701 RepID=UPI001056FA2F|nr:hypothetical protein [Mesorhizobium ephedrae]